MVQITFLSIMLTLEAFSKNTLHVLAVTDAKAAAKSIVNYCPSYS